MGLVISMKNKQFSLLFALPVTTGVCGALLRAAQLKHAYDPATGALLSSNPISYGLIVVCFIAFIMAALAAFLCKNGTEFEGDKHSALSMLSSSVAAVFILAYAGLLFFSLAETFEVTKLILALFSVYCSVSLIAMGKYRFAERDSSAYCIFAAVPVFWACFVLILTFREKISDPIIANYVPLILAYILILFYAYGVAAHILGRKKNTVTVFSCFFGIFFIITQLLAPLFAAGHIPIDLRWLEESLPLLAFLFFMPGTVAQIIKK